MSARHIPVPNMQGRKKGKKEGRTTFEAKTFLKHEGHSQSPGRELPPPPAKERRRREEKDGREKDSQNTKSPTRAKFDRDEVKAKCVRCSGYGSGSFNLWVFAVCFFNPPFPPSFFLSIDFLVFGICRFVFF